MIHKNFRTRDYIRIGNTYALNLIPLRSYSEISKLIGLNKHQCKYIANEALGKIISSLTKEKGFLSQRSKY